MGNFFPHKLNNHFGVLQDDCKRLKLEVVIPIQQGKLMIEIRNKDGQAIDNQQVFRDEKIETAAWRLHHRMKRGHIL